MNDDAKWEADIIAHDKRLCQLLSRNDRYFCPSDAAAIDLLMLWRGEVRVKAGTLVSTLTSKPLYIFA